MLSQVANEKYTKFIRTVFLWKKYRLHKFEQKVELELKVGRYLVRTARDESDLRAAFALRYKVFRCEFMNRPEQNGLDFDEFDSLCDHLLIFDTKENVLIGTYRLNCSAFSDEFYSEREFHMDSILNQTGVKIELGRACIARSYRKTLAISLLWKGIAHYMHKVNAVMVFGCATIRTANPREAALLYHHFYDKGSMRPEFFSTPRAGFRMPDFDLWAQASGEALSKTCTAKPEELVPPLLQTYLKLGASVAGAPAFDPEFSCIDFLTILRKDDLNRALWKS